jgi:hypothetical protein
MNIYGWLVTGYNALIAPFPAPLRWLLTVALLVGVVVLFINLIRSSWLFLLVLLLLLPFLLPLVWGVLMDLVNFILYLTGQAGLRGA